MHQNHQELMSQLFLLYFSRKKFKADELKMNNLTSQLLHNVFKSFPKELTRSSTNTEELISLAVVSFTLVT